MSKLKFVVALLSLFTLVVIYACGGEDTAEPMQPQPASTARPAPTLTPAPSSPRMTPSTPSPAEVAPPVSTRVSVSASPPTPTSVPATAPTQAPMPSPTDTPAPALEPTSTPEPVSSGGGGVMADLPPECLTGGSLDDAALIIGCGDEAMKQLESVVVEAAINLGAMLGGGSPTAGDALPIIEIQMTRVMPDQASVVLNIPQGGEVKVILTGDVAYVNDPTSNGWIKLPDVPDELSEMFLIVSSFEEQIQATTDGDVEWNDIARSDDGSNYMISFTPPPDASGGSFFGPISMEFQVALDVNTFFHQSVSLVAKDTGGAGHKIVDIQYSRHNEPLTIEAPSEYIEAGAMPPPGGMVGPGSPGPPEVVGLAKNDEGDVEVKFNEPITVNGDVTLYVIDPATGGWELPMIGGSGADTLVFDTEPEGKPSLIPGESVIPGFIFVTAESEILDLDGNFVNPVFEGWVYPE